MISTKKNKINQLILKVFSEFFRKKALELSVKEYIIISITLVQVTNDLSSCKIYLSIYPIKYRNQIFIECKNNSKFYRKYLGNKLSKKLRIIPNLIFVLDVSLDYLYMINNEKKIDNNTIYQF